MRRLVVALIAVGLVLTLTGCGGGEEAAAPAPEPAPAAVAPSTEPTVVALSDNEPPVFSEFPTSTAVPKEIRELVDAKQPTLIYFHDPTQATSQRNRDIIDSVLEANRGLVELVTYDIGKYVTANASKPVNVKEPEFSKDLKYRSSIHLAQELGVSFTPFIVITDTQGYVIWKHKGLVDKDFLEREILRASN